MTELNVDTETVYGSRYFRDDHTRTSEWIDVFTACVELRPRGVQPGSVLDTASAGGLLVEALRDWGVEAFGIDVSPHAIAQVREDIRPYCWVGSVADPFPPRYDLSRWSSA